MIEELDQFVNRMGLSIPTDYRNFIVHNAGFGRDDGLSIYSPAEVVERNTTYRVQALTQRFLAVGDDGGDMFVVIEFADPSARPYLIDMGAIMPNFPAQLLKPLAPTWNSWQQSDFKLPIDDE